MFSLRGNRRSLSRKPSHIRLRPLRSLGTCRRERRDQHTPGRNAALDPGINPVPRISESGLTLPAKIPVLKDGEDVKIARGIALKSENQLDIRVSQMPGQTQQRSPVSLRQGREKHRQLRAATRSDHLVKGRVLAGRLFPRREVCNDFS